jgi:hypothetical protein
MGGVNHNPLWLWLFAGKRRENPIKNTKAAPADEAVVKRLDRYNCTVSPRLALASGGRKAG